jgi:hypothetical protein
MRALELKMTRDLGSAGRARAGRRDRAAADQ